MATRKCKICRTSDSGQLMAIYEACGRSITGPQVLGTEYWAVGSSQWVLGSGFWALSRAMGSWHLVLDSGYWALGTGY